MAYYDVSNDYGQPETQIAESGYDEDVSQQFLCDGTAGKPLCDFGYALSTSGVKYFRCQVLPPVDTFEDTRLRVFFMYFRY